MSDTVKRQWTLDDKRPDETVEEFLQREYDSHPQAMRDQAEIVAKDKWRFMRLSRKSRLPLWDDAREWQRSSQLREALSAIKALADAGLQITRTDAPANSIEDLRRHAGNLSTMVRAAVGIMRDGQYLDVDRLEAEAVLVQDAILDSLSICRTDAPDNALREALEEIDRLAEAGLCQMKHEGTRLFHKDIRKVVATTLASQSDGWRLELGRMQKARDILMAAPKRIDGDTVKYEIDGPQVSYLLDEIIRPALRGLGEYEVRPPAPAGGE